MVVAGLLVRTVYNLQTRALGFEPDGLVTMTLDLPENTYPDDDARRQFYSALLEETRALPVVRSAHLLDVVPGAGFGTGRTMDIEGREVAEGQARPGVLVVTGSEGWQETLGISLLAGRGFGPEDGPETPSVALLAKDVAERYWPDEDPIGRRIRMDSSPDADWVRIVGIVGDVRSSSDTERPAQHVYLPYSQNSRSFSQLLIASGADPQALMPLLRQAVWSIDANQPIDGMTTVRQAQYDSGASSYALILLFVSFAMFALIMAAIGIYGVMSYSVSQRQGEIGLRMALGAEAGVVRSMVLKQGLRLLAVGVVVGLVAAFAVSRLLGSVVFGVSTTDPLTFVGVPLVLGLVATLANYVPARRATRMDPVTALRAE